MEQDVNIEIELERIDELFQHIYNIGYERESGKLANTLEDWVDKALFPSWKGRHRCTSTEDMRDILGLDDKGDFSHMTTVETCLSYLDYVSNILTLLEKSPGFSRTKVHGEIVAYLWEDSSFRMLKQNLAFLLDHLGYQQIYDETREVVLLVQRMPAATEAASYHPESALEIYSYNSYLLKGKLNEKRKILSSLAKKFESILKELRKMKTVAADDALFLLNSVDIRHDNPKAQVNFNETQLESWYDETYQCILLSLLISEHNERHKRIKEIKTII